jgi:hypothetical protein
VPHARGRGRIDPPCFGQPHLVDQRTHLETLHHAEALQQCQVRGEHLGETAGQWLVRRVTGDIERQHGDRLRITRAL